MKRLAIFAHYDGHAEVKRYITFYLEALREHCTDITFVSTAPLPEAELAKVRPYCGTTLLMENVGFDFGMWKHALDRTEAGDFDEIVLTNSSIFGPLWSLGPAFERMTRSSCDFWGMTDNLEIAWHIQSYFLVFKRPVLVSSAWKAFWSAVLPYRDKAQVIRCYEVGLTIYLVENAFRAEALVPIRTLPPFPFPKNLYKRKRNKNPTAFYPTLLLERGMPFVKVELLRDNPAAIALGPTQRAIDEARFDRGLIEFDRPGRAIGADWRSSSRTSK
jgi:lipopolysaccharide biosynthesis protein